MTLRPAATKAVRRAEQRVRRAGLHGVVRPPETLLRVHLEGEIHRVGPDFGSTSTASNRDYQSNCWVNWKIMGEPCEFQVWGPVTLSLQKKMHLIWWWIWYEVDERWCKSDNATEPCGHRLAGAPEFVRQRTAGVCRGAGRLLLGHSSVRRRR
jgi:hypothetical protein